MWKTGRRSLLPLLALALGLSALSSPASAHVMPLTDRQVAAGSAHVVVAVVVEARVRWNEQHTLLVTDYSLRVEDRLRGTAADRITVTIPGGTLDGQSHGTCVSTPLTTGARYLLFLQDLDRPLLVPITGGWQGAVQEVPSREGKRLATRGPRGEAPILSAGGDPVEFSQVVRATRELLTQVAADPRPADTAWTSGAEDPGLPVKRYSPARRANPAAVAPAASSQTGGEGAKFYVEHAAATPLVFDPLPGDSPFSPVDQQMMAYWNLYARQPLFLVAAEPSPEWGYNNGVSEMAGFPSSQTLMEQFGMGWDGAFYAATLFIFGPDGRIVEADLAFNPGRSWFLSDTRPGREGWENDTRFNFKAVVLSLLASAWGYQGLFSAEGAPEDPAAYTTDTVTKGPAFNHAALLAEDAKAVRSTFGGRPIRDGLISPYSIFVSPEGYLTESYAYPEIEAAQAGTSMSFSAPIKIENPGTAKLIRPTVEIYLTPEHGSMGGAILLKRIKLKGTLASEEVRQIELGALKLPANTPAGDYSFAFVLRDPKDAYQGNNRVWSHPEIVLTVTR